MRQLIPPQVGERVEWSDPSAVYRGTVERVTPSEMLVRVEEVEPVDEWQWLPTNGLYGLKVLSGGVAAPGVGHEGRGQ